MSGFLVVVSQVAILFLIMAVGYVITKLGKMSQRGSEDLSYLCIYIVTPCLIIQSLEVQLSETLAKNLIEELIIVMIMYVVFILISMPMFPSRNQQTRSVLQFGMIFSNLGFMGFPLIESLLGESATIYTVFNMIGFTVFQWTYGIYLMGGKLNAKKIFINPGMIGLYLGLPLLITGYTLPSVIDQTIHFLANLNTPLAMIVLGSQMARSNIAETLGHIRLFEASAVRMILMPAIVLVCLIPLNLDPTLFVCLVVLAATPTAGMTSMLSETYHQNTTAAAQLVSLCTLLSVLTLPVFAAVAKNIAGLS